MQDEFINKIRTFVQEELLGKDSFYDSFPEQPLSLYDTFTVL